ncbi:60S ribosomal protein L8B [Mortierella polycephala]|uniref:60S ribosomal protein L8B n=1 Tax=Mortierella polycephala TaxID=41804 RepID=A0A9P6QC87_9FUNG|nr:60S ribosomal protein L8B [Mortierella polycephala]
MFVCLLFSLSRWAASPKAQKRKKIKHVPAIPLPVANKKEQGNNKDKIRIRAILDRCKAETEAKTTKTGSPKGSCLNLVRTPRQRSIPGQLNKDPDVMYELRLTMDKLTDRQFFKFARKYRPETRTGKLARKSVADDNAEDQAEDHVEDQAKQSMRNAQNTENLRSSTGNMESTGSTQTMEVVSNKAHVLKHGLNHVADLIIKGRVRLCIIAADVDPIDLVAWLPALCRKKKVTYGVVDRKVRLGSLVNKRSVPCVVFTEIRDEEESEFKSLVEAIKANYNEKKKAQKEKLNVAYLNHLYQCGLGKQLSLNFSAYL